MLANIHSKMRSAHRSYIFLSSPARHSLLVSEKTEGKMTINHLHLKVSDVGRSVEFYCSMFGFREKVKFSDDFLFLQDESGFDLALDRVESVKPMPDGIHFGFALDSRKKVEDLLEKFKTKYPRLLEQTEIKDNGSWGDFGCVDPDGHHIQIYWDVDLH